MSRPLLPLAALASGALAAAAAAFGVAVPPPAALPVVLLVLGVGAALRCRRESHPLWWALVGFAIAAAPALQARSDALVVRRIAARGGAAFRIEAVVRDGWRPAVWGARAGIRVVRASHRNARVPLRGRAEIEVRGRRSGLGLPPPGSRIEALVSLRVPPGGPHRVLLVASSPRLLEQLAAPAGLAALRDRLARRLLAAAGTDVRLVRAAELAAALALGRRDLLPRGRTARWRDSGLAHVLAVSGLHVGLVGGMAWLVLALSALPLTPSRLAVAGVLVAYAAAAGGSPSAARAAAMGVVYLMAKAAGRPLVPMAAVLLVLLGAVIVSPTAIAVPGVQLTFWITAALVHWAPPLAEKLPLPRWLAWSVAVPLVAQLAAAPLVALHFHTVRPGAVLTNLAAVPLLPALLAASLAAAVAAPTAAVPTAVALHLVALGERVLTALGSPARAVTLTLTPPPGWVQAALAPLLIATLLPGRWGRRAVAAAAVGCAAAAVVPRSAPPPASAVALPVRRGAATLLTGPGGRVLVDGGVAAHGAVRELRALGVRDLAAVAASHPDADHVAGLPEAVREFRPRLVLLPRWTLSRPEMVPLLRAAHATGAAVFPMHRGLSVRVGSVALAAVWPPRKPPADDNDASLVLLASAGGGTVVLPGDAGRRVERALARDPWRAGAVLVLAHHGSRTATGEGFLAAVQPRIALIPAGSGDPGHPHRRILERLRRHHVPFCLARGPGLCGAVYEGTQWRFLR